MTDRRYTCDCKPLSETESLSSRPRTSCVAATRGFTLIELVTTIVIVAVLGAIAAPRFFDNQVFGDRGYIDEIAFTLRYAQKIAIASQCDVSVAINAAGYVAMQQEPLGNSCSTVGLWTTAVGRTDGSALSGSPPANVVLNPAATIVFESDGGIAGAAPVLSVGAFTLSVDADSGLVTVQP